jgi:hypothetical protein
LALGGVANQTPGVAESDIRRSRSISLKMKAEKQ